VRLLLAALLCVGAAACAASPPRTETDFGFSVPQHWSGAEAPGGRSSRQWWREFEDAELELAILEALAHNYDLAAAAARMEQAGLRARIAGAALSPQFEASLAGSRTKRNFLGFGGFTPGGGILSSTSNAFGLSLNVAWEIDLWGRIRAGTAAALADAEAAMLQREAAELSLAAETAKSWFAAIEAREQLELARETVASYESTTRNVRARYQRGVSPALDLRLALTELAGAKALVERRSQEFDGALRVLEIVLGRYPSRTLEPALDLPRPKGSVPSGLPAQLLVRRPDVVAAERSLAASGARVAEARAALFPRLALTASSGTAAEDIADLLKRSLSVWSLAGNLAQPIFEGGRLRAGVDLARAEQVEAAALYASAALEAYREVETFLAAESYLANREQQLGVAAEQARAALRLANERYSSGLEQYVTVLASQRNVLRAESDHIAVRRDRLETRVDLYLALGGGFEGSELLDQASAATSDVPDQGASS